MAMDMLFSGNVEKMEELEDNEEILNFLNTNITEYLVKINALELEDNDRQLVPCGRHHGSHHPRYQTDRFQEPINGSSEDIPCGYPGAFRDRIT